MSEPTASSTNLQRIVAMFEQALAGLGVSSTSSQIEEWSVLVHECMSGRGRSFHDVAHVYEIAAGGDAVQVLAALFHDTVYYQVDGGLAAPVQQKVRDAVVIRGEIIAVAPAQDWPVAMVGAVFGFAEGRALTPYSGLNEFLSALVAVRSLSPTLGLADLMCVTACIEATIPFRPPRPDGTAAVDELFDRLTGANESFDLGLSPAVVEAAVHRAADLANRDVANFADHDVARFLDETWKLLPESNDALRNGSVYTIAEYRRAIDNMEKFFASLAPERVFTRFRGRPDDSTLNAMIDRARRNIDIGYRYLCAKRLLVSLLEAVAGLTGGDAPVSLFMGDLPQNAPQSRRLEQYLPDEPPEIAADVHPEVLRLLVDGRASESGFDLKNAPLTAFLYRAMGDAAAREALAAWSHEDPFDWLRRLPDQSTRAIIRACTHLAVTRRAGLEQLERRLAGDPR